MNIIFIYVHAFTHTQLHLYLCTVYIYICIHMGSIMLHMRNRIYESLYNDPFFKRYILSTHASLKKEE